MQYFEYENRTKLCSGAHALEHLPYECALRGAKKPLLLTDPNLARLGLPDILRRAAEGLDLSLIFDQIPQDSSVDVVTAAAAFYREHHCDSLVALGGGSVLDTAKGVALVIQGRVNSPMALIGYEAQPLEQAIPFFAFPTTSGTGSEVTSVAVIAEPNRERKLEFVTSALCPQAAFLDPRMTEALPLRITASTGMDALCHALEAFTCRQKNPISDGMAIAALAAIEAIRKLRALLHDAAGLPSHLEETGRVKHADLDAVSRKAIQNGALLYNPRPMSREPVLQILQKAW